MPDTRSALTRSIGASGVFRFIVAVAAMIAAGAAIASGNFFVAAAGVLFFLGAATFGYRVWRERSESE